MVQSGAPETRKLRVFAFDPGLGRRLETLALNEITLTIRDECADCDEFVGPVGEYLEVVDIDPASGRFYQPVDLNDDKTRANAGLAPDASEPMFHQQMVYAVAMTTIEQFELALGRPVLWAPHDDKRKRGPPDPRFVRRLRIYPHALREANAYYSPAKKALLFGYFPAGAAHPTLPEGGMIFTCLSHDVIAHEVTHAVLDGLHPRWRQAANPDQHALHEAIADIVAIFQRFSKPAILKDQIARARGDLGAETLLAKLAQEFGQAMGRGGALRDALGAEDEDGVWRRHEPSRARIRAATGPHDRGAILVAAVFQAFVNIYQNRTADLFRIASQGSGILPPGAILPDLVNRLAEAAATSAGHILKICLRALDYTPPVNVRLGDYLRAIITADADLFPDDSHGYRVAIVEAFTAWGLLPAGLSVCSPKTLLWPTPEELGGDLGQADRMAEFAEQVRALILNVGSLLQNALARKDLPAPYKSNLMGEFERAAFLLDRGGAAEGGASLRAFRKEMQADVKGKAVGQRLIDRVSGRNLLACGIDADREGLFHATRLYQQLIWILLTDASLADHLAMIGIRCGTDVPETVSRSKITKKPAVEAHSVRMARREGMRGQVESEFVVELTQRRRGYYDPKIQAEADDGKHKTRPHDFIYRAGCTLLIDERTFTIRRVIRTTGDICDDAELGRLRDHLTGRGARPRDAFRAVDEVAGSQGETFAHLHQRPEGG